MASENPGVIQPTLSKTSKKASKKKTSLSGMKVTIVSADGKVLDFPASTARNGRKLGNYLLRMGASVQCDEDGAPGTTPQQVVFDRPPAAGVPAGSNTKTRITLAPESAAEGNKNSFKEQLGKQAGEMADLILIACFAAGETVQAMVQWYQGQTGRFTTLTRRVEHGHDIPKYEIFVAEGNAPFTHMGIRHSTPDLKNEVGWEKIGMETLGTCAAWGQIVGGPYRGANGGPADNDADANSHYTTYITLADAARWTVWHEAKYCSGAGAGRHFDMHKQDRVDCPAASKGVRKKMNDKEAAAAGYPWSVSAKSSRKLSRLRVESSRVESSRKVRSSFRESFILLERRMEQVVVGRAA